VSAAIRDKLGPSLEQVLDSLWVIDCQTCNQPLPGRRPALSVDDFSSFVSASLHHHECRQSTWNDDHQIRAAQGATLSHRTWCALIPVTYGDNGEEEIKPFILINPGVAALGEAAIQGGPPARDAKLRLASAVVTRYHGAGAARTQLDAFTATFSKREDPTDIAEVTVDAPSATVLEVLQAARPDESNSGLRRLISQGAVLVGGAKKTDPEEKLELIDGTVLRSGRRIWHRIRTTG
jgi:hypothetical protein